MKREAIEIYGFRVAEPHHDGTPHWHAILFFDAKHVEAIRAALSAIWLAEYGNEPGAAQARVKFVRPDPEKGSATGYIAKYVAKNVDGAGAIGNQISDESGRPVVEDVSRVVAWAQIHGIRQFQQIGGPAVGLWREHRRLSRESENSTIEAARQAATGGEWRAFVTAVMAPGVFSGRNTTVRLCFASRSELNIYGEPRKPAIHGIAAAATIEITRTVRWRKERLRPSPSSSDLGPVSITVLAKSAAHPSQETPF